MPRASHLFGGALKYVRGGKSTSRYGEALDMARGSRTLGLAGGYNVSAQRAGNRYRGTSGRFMGRRQALSAAPASSRYNTLWRAERKATAMGFPTISATRNMNRGMGSRAMDWWGRQNTRRKVMYGGLAAGGLYAASRNRRQASPYGSSGGMGMY